MCSLFRNESSHPSSSVCVHMCCSLIGRRDEVDVEGSVLEEENNLECSVTYGATTILAEKVHAFMGNLVHQYLIRYHCSFGRPVIIKQQPSRLSSTDARIHQVS